MDHKDYGVQHGFGEVDKTHNTEEHEKKELQTEHKRVEGDHGVTKEDMTNKTGLDDAKKRHECSGNKGGCH